MISQSLTTKLGGRRHLYVTRAAAWLKQYSLIGHDELDEKRLTFVYTAVNQLGAVHDALSMHSSIVDA